MTALAAPLRAWVESAAGSRVAGVRALTGGYSNDNAVLTFAGGGELVLRRYLRTNACAVEAALAARLAGVVPVPEVVAADPTGEAAGEPAMLSALAPGHPAGEVLDGLAGPEAAELGGAIGEALAAAGTVTFAAPGFFGDGTLTPGPEGAEPAAGLGAWVARCLAHGNAEGHLTGHERRELQRMADEATPQLAVLHGSRRLVHGDFNPKNLLAERRGGRWRVAAVLDWEFAFSGAPLFDVGNMLRDPRPAGFEEAFLAGFRAGGGELPPRWRRLAGALDLYSLADLLTRPAGHRYFARAIERIRARVSS
ncbi:phosphotransferase family protein [Dactylosporangium salmoneum]|uniref:Aminoglycoside phosphotransferase domain-containing protein n=1 Tax=Dactylosporangium salmoneum TaxID=53361 RepID=A0ABN3HDM3_9ACTN